MIPDGDRKTEILPDSREPIGPGIFLSPLDLKGAAPETSKNLPPKPPPTN